MSKQTPRTEIDLLTQVHNALRECVESSVEENREAAAYTIDHLFSQLERELSDAHEQIAALEAKIDALMLEYFPEEMTQEQMENWANHQKVASEDLP